MNIGDLYQSADWKKEKHVPVIELPEKVYPDQTIHVTVSVGKEIPHPNTTEHHIEWVELYFQPDGARFPFQVGRAEFRAHGASVEGPNTSSVYTEPVALFAFKTGISGYLMASAYCNIHGLWSSSTRIDVSGSR
ncbi:class II SORL domain-containing protein [Thermodesulforhabdus norvegica]|uniref:Superoxide reductase n=1 Tax=Thermodesulforhabdus norvegica TaxID=39841 RepID=A0A1I4QYA5_9BACT|nr:class II SORL domain-containing protein [Thermodesulforhabdus norvegica]SFM45009.1 superoxide reductase [Thermodesulforhabdus norvegica]